MSSRQRLYLNLKQSILELFRTPAHWIKEFTGKWSIFDKPYLSEDYRGMHLDWPGPDWPSLPDSPPGFFPKKPRLWTFLFDPGKCWLGIVNADCNEEFWLSASVVLVPLYTLGTGINFWVKAYPPDHIVITSIGDSDSNVVHGEAGEFTTTIKGYIGGDWSGTAVICVTAALAGGKILRGFQVENPYGDGPGVLRLEHALMLPKLWQREEAFRVYECGCIEFEVSCCNTSTPIAWDDLSDGIITRPNGGGEYADIAVTGSGTPFTWSVSGTGFELLYAQTNGTGNVLIADASACGMADITCTDCDGNIATGFVKCTTGTYTSLGYECGKNWGGYILQVCTTYEDEGKYKYIEERAHAPCTGVPCAGDGDTGCGTSKSACAADSCTGNGCGACCYSMGGVWCCNWLLSREKFVWECA